MKDAVFTMKLEPDLRAEFMAAAEASHRPASQVVREFMRAFVQQQQAQREHDAFGTQGGSRLRLDAGRFWAFQ
jgi:predicted transcriptional regulator